MKAHHRRVDAAKVCPPGTEIEGRNPVDPVGEYVTLIVKDDIQEGTMDVDATVVIQEPSFLNLFMK
jgi:hypothetical protein